MHDNNTAAEQEGEEGCLEQGWLYIDLTECMGLLQYLQLHFHCGIGGIANQFDMIDISGSMLLETQLSLSASDNFLSPGDCFSNMFLMSWQAQWSIPGPCETLLHECFFFLNYPVHDPYRVTKGIMPLGFNKLLSTGPSPTQHLR